MEIRNGDIALLHNYFNWKKPMTYLSWAIRFFTRSPWNHAGILVVIDSEVFVIEALAKGITKRNFKEWNIPSDKYYEILRPKERLSKLDEHRVAFEALSLVGIPYDYFNIILHQPILIIFGIWIGRKKQGNKKLVCSELVAYLYRDRIKKWWKTTPKGIFVSGKFESMFNSKTGNL